MGIGPRGGVFREGFGIIGVNVTGGDVHYQVLTPCGVTHLVVDWRNFPEALRDGGGPCRLFDDVESNGVMVLSLEALLFGVNQRYEAPGTGVFNNVRGDVSRVSKTALFRIDVAILRLP